MREAHPTERAVGIRRYVSDAPGTGGRLRERPAEFRVREIETVDPEPIDRDPGAYPCVVLRATLSGWDTNDFAARLSDALGASRERVAWAGTKDKRAVTTQLFSVRGLDAEGVQRLRAVDVGGAEIDVLGRLGRDLGFGDLAGNEFEIVVADPERPGAVDAVAAELRAFARGEYDAGGDGGGADDGDGRGADGGETSDGDAPATDPAVAVPNFFGQQRFGSRRPVTHRVGLRAVRGDWRGAVLAYVGDPSEAEPASTREARERVEREAERESPDWRGALEAFPRRLGYERSMLQRLAETEPARDDDAGWRAALGVVPSSLRRLFVNAAQSYAFNEVLSRRLERGLPFGRPVAGDVVAFADDDLPEGAPGAPDPDRLQRADDGRVDVLARHCERGRAFVTAPLVGTETELGGGVPGEIERAVLDDLGIAPADFDLPEEWASRGTRRAIRVRTELTVERDPLTLSFALPSGSYATVLAREFLKVAPAALR